jgi:methionyl-tRNA formyltransferase
MKIGLLAGNRLSDFRISTLKSILEDQSFSISLAIIDSRPEKSIRQKLLKNLKRGRGGYILVMAFNHYFGRKEKSVHIKSFCQTHGIDVIETLNPYSPATLAQIKQYQLDVLILTGGFGIVRDPLISITPLGILSYHHGDMRKYRGMPPAMWELYNNEPEMGLTVQLIAPGLDCGIPVEEKTIKIHRNDNLRKLRKRAFQESAHMMHQALLNLANPNFVPTRIEQFGQVYTLPNLSQWLLLQLKIGWRKLNTRASSLA